MGDYIPAIKMNNQDYPIAKPDAVKVSNPFLLPDDAMRLVEKNKEIQAKRAIEKLEKEMEDKVFQRHKMAVENIIKNDPAAPKDLNTEKMAQYIMDASREFNVDQYMITSIAQHESHFTQKSSKRTGKGIMQMTSISIKDMYQRQQIYDKSILPILKKYKTPEKLIKAIETDPQLNIRLGTALYKEKLKEAKGQEREALKRYNASPLKESYSRDVYAKVLEARKNVCYESVA